MSHWPGGTDPEARWARFASPSRHSLHRVEISIIPRNFAQPARLVEKLGIREEGIAERFLEIDGVWEDHMRYAITSEERVRREAELVAEWLEN